MASDPISAARDLLPLIRRHRDTTEADRRIAAPIVERLREMRLCRMAIAREHHGLELPLCDALEVYEALAGAEPSVGWIVWNNALPCLMGRFLEPAARAEIFADPTWLYASSTRPTGKAVVHGDGFRVSGRWSLVSGCELAEWIGLVCPVEENGGPRMLMPGVPELRMCFVRRGEFEILDTWHVGGLRGTGSHDVVVADKPIPARRTVVPGSQVTLDSSIARIPVIATMGAGYGAQLLGIGRCALDTLVGLTGTKVNVEAVPGLRDRPAVQAAITRHTTALDAARAHLHARADHLWELASAGKSATLDVIGTMHAAAHHAAEAGREAVEAMYAAAGTSALYIECPLERIHRDVHAMLRHIVAQPVWIEDTGRVRLGMAPTHPLYAL